MRILKFWFPVILYSGMIFTISSRPNLHLPFQGILPVDKILHAIEYGIFGFLLARAVRKTIPFWQRRVIIVMVTAGAIAYGMTDEWHQSFVPGRDCSFFDLMADGVGGFLGGWIYTHDQNQTI